ncbi:MAG: Gfo/Idh/MocA family oxidoreductase [Ruthenibacterium sp.]
MESLVNVAIIGAGFMGKTHLNAYQTMENARVTAICDLNEEQGKALAAEVGCTWFHCGETMLEQVPVDVVDICLPTFLHEEYVLLAARHHKHVLCEKPVTLSIDAYDRMAGAAREAGVQFAVGQAVRFWPEYVKAKQLYDEGCFGTIKYVHASRLSVHPAWSEWYRRPENSGGGLFDLHLHDVDYLCYLLGRVKTVYAIGKRNELGCWNHVVSSLTFENGISAVAEGVIEMPQGFPFTMELTIVGDQKGMEYRMRAGANLEDVDSAVRKSSLYGVGEQPQVLDIEPYDAYTAELRYFIDCIEANRPISVITPEDARHVLSVILAIRTSLENGEAVQL